TDYNDAGYPRCCGDEGSEIWEAAGGGNSACVNGETVSSGGVASNDRSYLTKDGELHWCKVPGGASKPYSWLTEWYECDYVSTSSGEYYCGAGGTDKEGKWYTLQNSGCQLVERIRGGRIIVH
ncbi:MAG: hypothetical protein MUP63_02930, partial [Candidatus Nanohaloarchaeota archaeon QJJ-7]|nr:hypothetical protein [Candidatus Nanohaloarchaeota archaeon QJJ-7]